MKRKRRCKPKGICWFSRKIIEKLNSGIINLAIIDGDAGICDNSAESFYEDEIFIISSKDSDIKDKEVLDAEDLKNKKFVLGDLDDNSKKCF